MTGDSGPNQRQWLQVSTTTDSQGNLVTSTNAAFTEVASGLNYWDPVAGAWVPTREEFDAYPGGCVATNGQEQVILANNANTSIGVDLQFNQLRWTSHVLGLSYQDRATGSNVLISEVQDCQGVISSTNTTVYDNAFTDFKADLVYTYKKSGLEQGVVILERPPLPEAFGLNSASTVLQVLTEFTAAPAPVITSSPAPASPGQTEQDQFLDFGGVVIGPGNAFTIGADPLSGISVSKEWATISGRTLLVESVPITAIATSLDQLPPPQQASAKSRTDGVLRIVSTRRLLPEPKIAKANNPKSKMKMAQGVFPHRGFYLDYSIVTSATNFIFRNDQTWLVSSPITLSGTTVFEGGAVIKLTNTFATLITLNGPLICSGGIYLPTILTSINDNSVGSQLPFSTGLPSNSGGQTYLYANAVQTNDYKYLRIAYANWGIVGVTTNMLNVWHSQFLNCGVCILPNRGLALRNVLMVSNQYCFGAGGSVSGENVTFDQCGTGSNYFFYGSAASFTNSILTPPDTVNTLTLSHCVTNSTGAGIYQIAGAGNYYLVDSSTNRNAATTNINSVLLASLAQRTTYPPVLLTNVTYATSTTLDPQAQRDTDAPDIGYHYDPIDYIAGTITVTNDSVFTVDTGTALAACNANGILIRDPSSIISVGTPLTPNWMVWYQNVQEQPILLNGAASGTLINPNHSTNAAPSGLFQFTKFASVAGANNLLYHGFEPLTYTNLSVQECEFWSGGNTFGGGTNGSTVVLNNNLFYRTTMGFNVGQSTNSSLSVSNNLFYGVATKIAFIQPAGTVWSAFNNSFDTCLIGGSSSSSNGYNAYINSTNRINPATGTDVISSNVFVYQTGPLGSFYQPTNSILIGKGSTTANLTGLYHYTVTTNEVVEGTNTVSIGYHYVAVDANGNPLDTNGDGIPDYLEDANGNGLIDSGEIGWNVSGDPGLQVIITRPKSNSVIP